MHGQRELKSDRDDGPEKDPELETSAASCARPVAAIDAARRARASSDSCGCEVPGVENTIGEVPSSVDWTVRHSDDEAGTGNCHESAEDAATRDEDDESANAALKPISVAADGSEAALKEEIMLSTSGRR